MNQKNLLMIIFKDWDFIKNDDVNLNFNDRIFNKFIKNIHMFANRQISVQVIKHSMNHYIKDNGYDKYIDIKWYKGVAFNMESLLCYYKYSMICDIKFNAYGIKEYDKLEALFKIKGML